MQSGCVHQFKGLLRHLPDVVRGKFPDLKARSFSDAMIANAGRFNLNIATTSPTLPDGRRGFVGMEAVARPHINEFTDVSSCTYVPENGGIDFCQSCSVRMYAAFTPVFSPL